MKAPHKQFPKNMPMQMAKQEAPVKTKRERLPPKATLAGINGGIPVLCNGKEVSLIKGLELGKSYKVIGIEAISHNDHYGLHLIFQPEKEGRFSEVISLSRIATYLETTIKCDGKTLHAVAMSVGEWYTLKDKTLKVVYKCGVLYNILAK